MIKTITNDKHCQSISPEDSKITGKLLTNPFTCWHILNQSDFASVCTLRQVSRAFYNYSTQFLDGYKFSPLAKRSIYCHNFQGFRFDEHYHGLSRCMQSGERTAWCSVNKIEMPGIMDFNELMIEDDKTRISKNRTNESKVLLVRDELAAGLRHLISNPTSTTAFNTITKLIIVCHNQHNPDITINSLLTRISENANMFCKLSSLEIRVGSTPFTFTVECPIFKTITLGSSYVNGSASFILSGLLFKELKTVNIGVECDVQLKDPFDNLTTVNIGIHNQDPQKYTKLGDKARICSASFNGEIKFEPTLEGRSHGYVTRVSKENNLAEIQDNDKQEYIEPTGESCGKFLILLLLFMLGLSCLRSYLHPEKSR